MTAPRAARRPSLRGILVSMAAALAALVLLGAAGTVVLARMRDRSATELADVLRPAHESVDEISRSLVEQEDGVRGYVITGDVTYMQPTARGVARYEAALARARRLLRGHPRELRMLDEIDAGTLEWRNKVAGPEVLAAFAQDRERAIALVRSPDGRDLFAQVSAKGDRLHDRMDAIVADARQSIDSAQRVIERVQLVGAFLALALLLGFGVVLSRLLARPLDALGAQVGRVVDGHVDEPITPDGPQELATLAEDVERMRRTMVDQAAETLRRRLVEAQEAERRAIASEIHDDSVQALSATSMRLQRLRRRLDDPELVGMVRDAEDANRAALERLRHLLFELYPPTLDRDGLVPSLELYAEEQFAEGTTWSVRTEGDGALPDPVTVLAYRIAREAMANVARHAAADHVDVVVRSAEDGVAVVVHDDGRGFDPAHAQRPRPGHLGLPSVRDLAEGFGGRFEVRSDPGRGTTVEFWLPTCPDGPVQVSRTSASSTSTTS